MKKFILIAALVIGPPAGAQDILRGSLTGFSDNNNAGLDCIQNKDYRAAERHLRQAYSIAAQEGSPTRMRASLGNLSALYQLTGRSSEQGRVQAQLSLLNQPQVSAPCNNCVDSRILWSQMHDLEMQTNQQTFDRTTFREDQTFQLEAQREALESQRRAYQDMLNRQQERQQLTDYYNCSQRGMGTSYMSRYNH